MPKRKIFCFVLSVFLALAGASKAAASRGETPRRVLTISGQNAEHLVTEESLRNQVEFMSAKECEGRATGSQGSTLAGWWIGRQFLLAGLTPLNDSYFHGFLTEGGAKGENISGLLPAGSPSGRYIIVAAHYDHIGTLGGNLYPGADCNASGVAALVSIAGMLRHMADIGKSYGKGVIFVALDGKERNLAGSRELLRLLREGGLTDPCTGKPIGLGDIDLMVNLDQIGSSLAPVDPSRKDYLIMLAEGSAASGRDLLLRENRDRGIGLDLHFTYYGSREFTNIFYRRISDQAPFLGAGVPSVMFTSGITLRNNKPSDSPSTLDYPVFRRRVLLIFHYLNKSL